MMKGRSILLVEDNPSDVELVQRALQRGKITSHLVVASDGQEALDYLFGAGLHAGRDTSDLPAMTLLDLKLPKVGGLEVLRRIRAAKLTRRLPVVILSSSREEKDVAAGYDLGANSYTRKPVEFEDLAQAVERLGRYWLTLNEPPPRVEEN
jgi:two-component system response regulator